MFDVNNLADKASEELNKLVGRSLMVDKSKIFPVADTNEFVCELFRFNESKSVNLISVGHLSAETCIAADKAGLVVTESIDKTPFNINVNNLMDRIKTDSDIVFIANPNKITGANLSLSEIEQIARAVPKGLIIVDEFYFDFFGITTLPLLDLFKNIVIIRSFTAPFGLYSSDAGFVIASKEYIEKFKSQFQLKKISSILRKTIMATLLSEDAMTNRLQEIHDESLRVSTALTRLGIQCRITATDFLLIKVASPKDVGNTAASNKIFMENLDGYPMMNGYIKYRIESHFTNERLIDIFKKMPVTYYKTKSTDNRPVTIKSPKENLNTPPETKNRIKSTINQAEPVGS